MADADRLVAVGVDGAPAGWVAACSYDMADRAGASRTCLHLLADVEELASFIDRSDPVVAIDVPIGVPDAAEFRRCDVEARRLLRVRASSVFAPPARYMLAAAGDYAAIRELVQQRRDASPGVKIKSLSAQAAGITKKIREVDEWVQTHPESEHWLLECHPELSFLVLNGGSHVPATKHTPSGLDQRRQLVCAAFGDAEEQLTAARSRWTQRQATRSDALDAYAALSTALRFLRGEHIELGEGERDSRGVLMRMVF